MNGYSEDLRQKIVSAVGRGMSKAQAARTFDVSLSSVKRYYVNKAQRGESLAPKKSPGSAPKLDQKATKLLEEDLNEGHGCELVYLPTYSPDYNPIEEAFAKIKSLLRKTAARSKEALLEAIGAALCAITAQDAQGFFEHAGYSPPGHLL